MTLLFFEPMIYFPSLYFSFIFLTLSFSLFGFFNVGIRTTLYTSLALVFEFSAKRYCSLSFIFFLDTLSLLFRLAVLTITLSVLNFSFNYISQEKFFWRFYLIVFLFIFSILILIFRARIETLIIGWDGLGVSSFFLVAYYNNRVTLASGYITILVNRLGDAFFLVIFIFIFSAGANTFISILLNPNFFFLFVIGAATKRAQIPFSAWLPAAMAAPTPVSALVHSSTLVTAGIFVLVRYNCFWAPSSFILLNLIYFIGITTLLIASLAGLFEKDIKKLVALSTLSQLGLIISALGIKAFDLVIFHLLTHAFFKALLFIATGTIIHSINGYQDFRKHGISTAQFPLTFSTMAVANFSLMGFPFLSGFVSKDLIIENLWLRAFSRFKALLLLFRLTLTFFYVTRFLLLIKNSAFHPQLTSSGEKCFFLVSRVANLIICRTIAGMALGSCFLINTKAFGLTKELKFLLVLIIIFRLAAQVIIPSKNFITSWSVGYMFNLYEIKKNLLKFNFFSFSKIYFLTIEKKLILNLSGFKFTQYIFFIINKISFFSFFWSLSLIISLALYLVSN